jgi:hypothetical protein
MQLVRNKFDEQRQNSIKHVDRMTDESRTRLYVIKQRGRDTRKEREETESVSEIVTGLIAYRSTMKGKVSGELM